MLKTVNVDVCPISIAIAISISNFTLLSLHNLAVTPPSRGNTVFAKKTELGSTIFSIIYLLQYFFHRKTQFDG